MSDSARLASSTSKRAARLASSTSKRADKKSKDQPVSSADEVSELNGPEDSDAAAGPSSSLNLVVAGLGCCLIAVCCFIALDKALGMGFVFSKNHDSESDLKGKNTADDTNSLGGSVVGGSTAAEGPNGTQSPPGPGSPQGPSVPGSPQSQNQVVQTHSSGIQLPDSDQADPFGRKNFGQIPPEESSFSFPHPFQPQMVDKEINKNLDLNPFEVRYGWDFSLLLDKLGEHATKEYAAYDAANLKDLSLLSYSSTKNLPLLVVFLNTGAHSPPHLGHRSCLDYPFRLWNDTDLVCQLVQESASAAGSMISPSLTPMLPLQVESQILSVEKRKALVMAGFMSASSQNYIDLKNKQKPEKIVGPILRVKMGHEICSETVEGSGLVTVGRWEALSGWSMSQFSEFCRKIGGNFYQGPEWDCVLIHLRMMLRVAVREWFSAEFQWSTSAEVNDPLTKLKKANKFNKLSEAQITLLLRHLVFSYVGGSDKLQPKGASYSQNVRPLKQFEESKDSTNTPLSSNSRFRLAPWFAIVPRDDDLETKKAAFEANKEQILPLFKSEDNTKPKLDFAKEGKSLAAASSSAIWDSIKAKNWGQIKKWWGEKTYELWRERWNKGIEGNLESGALLAEVDDIKYLKEKGLFGTKKAEWVMPAAGELKG